MIQDLVGHVSEDMVKHYSHIRTDAKRRAVAAIVAKADTPELVMTGESSKDAPPLPTPSSTLN